MKKQTKRRTGKRKNRRTNEQTDGHTAMMSITFLAEVEKLK